MKKTLRSRFAPVAGAAALLLLTGCPNLMDSGSSGNGNSGSGDEAEESFSGNFAGYSWTVNGGTARLTDSGALSVSKSDAYGIALQLADSDVAAIAQSYGDAFYVEAYVKVDEYIGKDDKNFGLASHIGTVAAEGSYAGSADFYYAGINFNGRTQLGTKITPKGVQFSSLASNAARFKQTDQYWKLRYEYDTGVIKGYVNDIRFVKAYNGDALDSYTIPSAERVAAGSIGFVTSGESFTVKSFKVGELGTGKAGIKLCADAAVFDTLTEDTTAFIMMMDNDYCPRAGDTPVTVIVTATDSAGDAAEWSVSSSNEGVVTAAKTADGTGFVLTPLAAGTSVVTVTNTADQTQTRTFYCTVGAALGFNDTDYALTAADVYPTAGTTDVYEDSRLVITFDSVPVLNEGEIGIYAADGTTEVDRIRIGAETDTVRDGTAAGSNTFTLKNFMVQVDGNSVHIVPHSGVLEPGTEYVVGVADGVITGTLNGNPFTGFDPAQKRWSFTTRAAYTPTNAGALKVGASDSADYRTVQAALQVASDGAVVSLEAGTYREIVYYRGGKNVTIEGPAGNDKGFGCEIVGINCNAYNGSSHTRASFYWSGSDLTLKNLTIRNAYDRNVDGTAQSEALYFANGTGKKLVAYNCSFCGHQDTIQTSGKNWFYKCRIEGDTDFIWGTADVALFETCDIVMLDTSLDTVKASDAIIFETRVGSVSENLVPKGYVLFGSTITADHPSSYFARRATAKSSTTYYDQAAIVNCTVNGTLNDELWLSQNVKSDKNLPEYVAKDGTGTMHVGWKTYGGSGYSAAKMDTYEYAGTISDAVYNKEYNGRNAILNRVFRKTSGTYENAAEIWDIEAYETEFSASADTSTIDDAAAVNGATGEYSIADFATDTTKWAAIADGTSSDTYVSWTDIVYHSAEYGAAVQTGTGTVTVRVAGKSVISFIGSTYSNGTITVTDSGGNTVLSAMSTKTAADKSAFAFIYEGSETEMLTLSITGTTYVGKLTVREWVDEAKAVTAVSVSGASSVVIGDTINLSAAVTAVYCADPSVTWRSSDPSVATVDAQGTVTGVAAGTATITASSVFDPSKYGSSEITVTSSAATPEAGRLYEYVLTGSVGTPYTSADTFLKVIADADNGGHGLIMKNGSTVTVRVAGNATVTLLCCAYDAGANVAVVNSSGTALGSIVVPDKGGENAEVLFAYTGSADVLTFTYDAGSNYLHGVKIQN